MTSLDYAAYEALFNTGDDEALVARFFADDCAMVSANGVRSGKAELLAFLGLGARRGARGDAPADGAQPRRSAVRRSRHGLPREQAARRFPVRHAAPGRPDHGQVLRHLPAQPRRQDRRAQEHDLAARARRHQASAPRQPPEPGRRLPRLCRGVLRRRVRHASRTFYTDDVVLHLSATAGDIVGRQGIVDFYRPMFERVRESVTVETFAASDDLIAVDAVSRFTAIADAPDFVVGPLAKGEWIEVPVHVDYSLRDGLICDIAVTTERRATLRRSLSLALRARSRFPVLPAKTARRATRPRAPPATSIPHRRGSIRSRASA